jgi:hypothetical protein
MKKLNLSILVAVIACFTVSAYADMGSAGGHDLDVLWERAQASYDLTAEDAVLLLESRRVELTAAGALVTRVHRVVWIGTGLGIRAYADLRVPWNTETSALEVDVLRTWRDGRWWPDPSRISDTAVVHTLPHALDHADDYTVMRETMLLHDGVELPCIMETAYTITEKAVPAADGVFVFPQLDPAVVTELAVTLPPDVAVQHLAVNGAPSPVASETAGRQTLTWTLDLTPAQGLPHLSQPADHEPAIVWSTWTSWTQVRDHWRTVFDAAMVPGSALTDTLATRLAEERGGWSRLQAVVDLVDESARGIHYPHRFWQFAPRSAERTWATAYGHDLDRAVLAATLLAAAGFEAVPIFVGAGSVLTAPEIPRLAGMGDLQLIIKKPSTIFDPAAGTLTRGVGVIGKPLWRTDDLHEPFLGDSPWQDLMTLDITLEAAEDGSWTGHGFLDAGGVFSPFNDMAGPGTRSHDHVAQLLASVLPGAELTSFNPDIFNQYQVAGGFAFTLPAIETDDLGRRPLNVGRPAGGYLDHLPGGVNLYDASRMTPVGLPAGPLEQRVRIRIDTGTAAVVHHPAAVNVANAAGEFTVAAALDGSWLTVERSLRSAPVTIAADQWPALRALLLEEADTANGMILLP